MSEQTTPNGQVLLISMPWAALHSPSIQLGTIQAVLQRQGIACRTMPVGFAFIEWLHQCGATSHGEKWTIDDYDYAANCCHTEGLGEWVFSDEAPLGSTGAAEYFAVLTDAGVSDRAIRLATVARDAAPVLLDRLANQIAALRPDVVGFSMMFSQTVPSVQLARRLKAQLPHLKIICGGANCDDTMGAALHQLYPWLDVVIRGEAENVAADVVSALLANEPVPHLPGLCIREGTQHVVVPFSGDMVDMSQVPRPDYRDYFDALQASGLGAMLAERLVVPFESARGCWWGEKSHCTFCGLNGHTMKFRSKDPGRVVNELTTMASEYETVRFVAVDNIIDINYFKTVLPALADIGIDWQLFYETKGNLKRWQLEMFAASGVTRIQPGLESLSTSILKLMAKGINALQNIYVLKWAAHYGVRIAWNIIAGIPGELPEEYDRMADLSRSLMHLDAPNMCLLAVDRFSPYHRTPEAFGLRITGPRPFYRFVFGDRGDLLQQLAYSFDYEYADQRNPRDYIGEMKSVVEEWREKTSLTYKRLRYTRGSGWLDVDDARDAAKRRTIRLTGVDARLFEACDEIQTVQSACVTCGLAPATSNLRSVQELFDELVRLRVLVCEGNRFLNVAIPPRRTSPPEPAVSMSSTVPVLLTTTV